MKTPYRQLAWMLLCALAGVVGSACGSTDESGYRCVRDEALLAQSVACARDDQCPCGSHCHLGLCRHECLKNADCPGWCDPFGRCRDSEDREVIGEIKIPSEGLLDVYPDHIRLYPWSGESAFAVRAERQDLGEVRIAADDGLLVRCQDDFVSECTLPSIARGQEVRVFMKPDGRDPARQEWGLNVYAGSWMRRVTLDRGSLAGITTPRAGVYRGQIWAETAAAVLQGGEPFTMREPGAGLDGLKLPVRIKIYPDGTLALSDTLGMFSGQAGGGVPWVFLLRDDGRFDAFQQDGRDLSLQVFIGESASSDESTATEIAFRATGFLRAVDRTLVGTLEVTMEGLGLALAPPLDFDERPRLSWRFLVDWKEDLPRDEIPPEPGSGQPPVFGPSDDRYPHALPWEQAVAACGDLEWPDGAGRAAMLEHYLCYDHLSDVAGMESVPFVDYSGQEDLTVLGDLVCDDPNPARSAFPFFTNAERPAGGLAAGLLLDSCLADLGRVHGAPPDPATLPPGAEGLDELSGCVGACLPGDVPDCIDGPLVLRALGIGLEAVERRDAPFAIHWAVEEQEAARLAHRLVQQWIQVHTFVAREARQASDAFLDGSIEELRSALETSLRGWNAVLHPKVAGRLLHLPAGILREPDYRADPDLASDASEDRTQPIGVSVVILEGLRAQLEAVTQLIVRARFEGRSAPEEIGLVLRYAAVLYALAGLLHAQSFEQGEPPPWEGRWQDAGKSFGDALAGMLVQYRALVDDVNPLGIEDDDLPLYLGGGNPEEARERFSVISEYLLNGWATTAVAAAVEAKTRAKESRQSLLERQMQIELVASEQQERILEIQRLYGEKIRTMCGNPHDLAVEDMLDPAKWPELSAEDCFLKQSDPACVYDERELLSKLTTNDVAYQLCVNAQLKIKMGERARLDNEFLDQALDDIIDGLDEMMAADTLDWWMQFDPGLIDLTVDFFDCLDADCEANDYVDFSDLTVTGTEDLKVIAQAQASCKAKYPGVSLPKRIEELDSSPLDKPDCYQGSIGELTLAARGAAKDVEAAKSELQDFTDAYLKAMDKCVIEESALRTMEAVEEKLNGIKKGIDNACNSVNFICDGGNSLVGMFSYKGGLGVSPGSLSGFVSGYMKETWGDLLGMDDITKIHDSFMEDFRQQIQRAMCFNDAEMHLVGADTQARRIERSMLDLAGTIAKMRNAQDELDDLIAEGRRRVAAERTRQHTSLFHDVWEDMWKQGQDDYRGALEDYRRAMRLAQRTLYLAVRAVEYEWQMSHTARAAVLAATDPKALEAVLNDLKLQTGPGTINGQPPDNLHYELSLKQHLLQLADRRDVPEGHHNLTDTERLRLVLTSPRYAHYDPDGAYLGQLIPFSVMPIGVFGLGETGGIKLLTGSDCAERLWSVALTIHGDRLLDGDSPYVDMDLLHRNTFFSQWCEDRGDGADPLQSVSVRPARNLFKDPVWGVHGSEVGSSVASNSEYTRARPYAYLNVSRTDLGQDDYDQGASTELAGRGLYGEYALFFSVEHLAADGRPGLHLERVDDILIRFDYVSVAKGW